MSWCNDVYLENKKDFIIDCISQGTQNTIFKSSSLGEKVAPSPTWWDLVSYQVIKLLVIILFFLSNFKRWATYMNSICGTKNVHLNEVWENYRFGKTTSAAGSQHIYILCCHNNSSKYFLTKVLQLNFTSFVFHYWILKKANILPPQLNTVKYQNVLVFHFSLYTPF